MCLCAFLDFIQGAQHLAGSCLQKNVAVSELQSEVQSLLLLNHSPHVLDGNRLGPILLTPSFDFWVQGREK